MDQIERAHWDQNMICPGPAHDDPRSTSTFTKSNEKYYFAPLGKASYFTFYMMKKNRA